MEEKTEKRVIKIGIGGFLLIILIVVLITAGTTWIVRSLMISNTTTKNNKANVLDVLSTNIENQRNTSTLEQANMSKKVDASKDWIYDANYENNYDLESYKYAEGVATAEFNVKVPYININSILSIYVI